MVISTTLIVISVLSILIWVFIEIQRLKHKLFAIALIGMIVLGYVSFAFVLKGQDINYKSVEGLTQASKIYFSWLGAVLGNFKIITSNAIKMDWSGNSTSTNS